MSHLFPLAFMTNTFAMTVLLIALGLTGNSVMAAEVGIVQGATLALFYAFSANARSLILSKSPAVSAHSMMIGRLLLLIPLAAISYWLSVGVAGVGQSLAIILIARRCAEWLGEVHLSEMERLGNQDVARKYFALQSLLLAIALGWLIGDFPYPLFGLSIWALLPLVFSTRFIWKSITTIPTALTGVIAKILPHLGSTAIIGITVYVFRLLILLIVGKETAGDLFTAFAIGGLTGSVFANALGASIALHEQRSGKQYFPPLLRHVLNLSLLLGILIFVAAVLQLPVLDWTGKSYFFWQATGLSMIGGVIMVYAQRIRFRLLQHDEEHDVFGPDVLMNILIITSVPFVFYLLGKEAMSGLYLLSSFLAFVFYLSAKKEKGENQEEQNSFPFAHESVRMLIAVMLLLPLFFQISTGVFRNPIMYFDSGGVLRNLPIPISVLACYGGILLLGTYRRAFISFGFIFLTCTLMVMSTIIVTEAQPLNQQAKLLLLIQFILPMFALVLGQVYEPLKKHSQNYYEKVFLGILLIVVPLQLYYSWSRGLPYLSPYLGLFSIYQHLQYVPIILISAYTLALFSLWHLMRYKVLLILLMPLMAIYVAASISMLAIGMLFFSLLLFAIFHWKMHRGKLPFFLLVIVALLSWNYLQHEKVVAKHKFIFLNDSTMQQPDIDTENLYQLENAKSGVAPNISQRIRYWKHYSYGVSENLTTFLLGHAERPDRSQFASAHNYYLDFIYNFGALGLLPMLFLLGYTIVLIFKHRKFVLTSSNMAGLAFVVIFLLIIDNSLKVSLRQPYSGIFIFFLWGILLTKLSRITNKKII